MIHLEYLHKEEDFYKMSVKDSGKDLKELLEETNKHLEKDFYGAMVGMEGFDPDLVSEDFLIEAHNVELPTIVERDDVTSITDWYWFFSKWGRVWQIWITKVKEKGSGVEQIHYGTCHYDIFEKKVKKHLGEALEEFSKKNAFVEIK